MLKVFFKKSKLLFSIIILIANISVYSQNLNHSNTLYLENHANIINDSLKTISSDFSDYTQSIGTVVASPFHWDSNDFLKAGGFLALSAGSFLLDQEVNSVFEKNRSKTLDKLEPIGYYYGSPVSTFPSALVTYFSGVIFENNWLRKTGLMLNETINLIGIVQVPTRIIFGRVRLYTGEKNTSFNFLSGLKSR